jgi:hypothetical protein
LLYIIILVIKLISGGFGRFLFSRLPFTMLVLQKAVKMVWNLPEVMRVAYAFMAVMLLWMALWSFGAAGVVASSMGDGGRWWLLVVSWQVLLFILSVLVGFVGYIRMQIVLAYAYLIGYCFYACMQVLSVSLFWTGAVLCNTVHVIVSGSLVRVSIHGGCEAASVPANSIMKSLQYALTTSFGSICYGSLFTAAIRTLRWEVLTTIFFFVSYLKLLISFTYSFLMYTSKF